MIEAGGKAGERLGIHRVLDCVILDMPSMIITSSDITSCKLCLPTWQQGSCLLFQCQRKFGEVGICWKAG